MGAVLNLRGAGGGKGKGGSARTPVEQPDSLRNTAYAAIVDLLSNGPVAGPAHPDQPLRDIYLNGTPVMNADGSLNFRNVELEYRLGTQDQSHIPGFPASASVTGVGVEVTQALSWSQAISNTELSAARVTLYLPQLMRTIDSGQLAGDRVGYEVGYAIDLATDGGAFVEVVADLIQGKTVNGYSRTIRVELPPATGGWVIRVRRTTPNAGSTTIQDALYVQSYAEVIDGKFRFPMSAVAGLRIDAEQFQSVPTRAYHWLGREIRIPSNYDPETRTYTGIWDGTFVTAYSNNPAWVFYDMVLSNLYGLGQYVDASMVDRYALYQIAAFCDQLVPDGQGGMEPRFVCNHYIQVEADALKLLNDLASIFRGAAYWADNQVVAIADAPRDPVYTFTNANVIDGRFEYAGSDLHTRKTVALVSWNDPNDFYRSKVEPVYDDSPGGIERYGIRKVSLVAVGCTSRSQAQRVGLYALYTSRMETGGIAFSVGLEGVIPMPGDIIRIADRNRAGRQLGGRITTATASVVTADRVPAAVPGNTLTVNLPSGVSQTRPIVNVAGRVITVSPAFSATPAAESVWAVDAEDLVTQQARVLAVQEGDGININISAVAHHPGKFDAIDYGIRLEPLPVSVIPPRVQLAPQNVAITEHATFHQGTTRHRAEITWDAPDSTTVAYDVQWRRDNGDWVQMPKTGTRLAEVPDIYAGDYVARVRAFNALEVPSLWAYSALTTLEGLVSAPPVVATLTATGEVMAIRLDWTFPVTPNIIERIEIRASLNNSFGDSYALTALAYPTATYTLYGLGYSTEMWFWVRLIDKNGTPGEWYPAASGAGLYGRPNQNPQDILDYLQGQIGESELAPDLIEQIQADVAEGIAAEIINEMIGDLSGDTEVEGRWYAGDDDDEGTFVGTVNTTTVINAGDYKQARTTHSLVAQVDGMAAVIREVEEVVLTEFEAVARTVETLAVQVNEQEAVLQETSEVTANLNGAVRSTYQLKAQVRSDGRVVQAGVALGAAIGEDGAARSEIIMMANTIAFVTSLNGALHAPFIFDVANDTAVLSNAFIGNATIGSAKLVNWLESDALGPGGVPVLRLNFRTGEIQLNSPSAGGGRLSLNNQLIRVYDGANTERVRLGVW